MKTMAIYFLMVFTACQNPLTQELQDYGDEFELAIGEEVIVGREKIEVKFVDVLEDSRCPSNVTCVWAGNGKVQLQIAQNDIQLNTYLEPHEVTLDDLNIQLVDLKPYPKHPRQFEKEDYKVRLVITKE